MKKDLKEKPLIYDWNKSKGFKFRHKKDLQLDDETLRDGLQSPSIKDPTIEEKLELIELMEDLGIDTADVGLPGSGPRAQSDILTIAKHISKNKMKITPNCAVRTVKQDITPLIEISQKVGYPIEACTFIGSSPIRQFAEDWTLDTMLKLTEEAVSYATENGLPVMYVTEDTTRANPRTLRKLYKTAIEAGAKRICVCDTVGHTTPIGVYYLMKFIQTMVKKTNPEVKIDWHGHSDRGLAIPNTMAAIAQGADRVHATALGIGERVGNTPMDLLLVNLKLEGIYDRDMTSLARYCQLVSEACDVPIPPNYPVMGCDAFRTGTGVHAAAIIKAKNKGDDWLADRVYSGVPASVVGLRQIIEIGFMSGVSNIVFWLKQRGIEPEKELVDEIFRAAKQHNRVLSEKEIEEIIKYHGREEKPALNTPIKRDKEIKSKKGKDKRKK
ncbi:MAG: 2-isopropylmalate synthase [Candidatus Zixiibacteriota bacterium]|nr:MAG: 2-isopropylmalate synthase [candidate division Zixibacteria bacterium]